MLEAVLCVAVVVVGFLLLVDGCAMRCCDADADALRCGAGCS